MKSEKDIEKDKAKMLEWLKKEVPNDYDKFDLQAEFDGSLTFLENKRQIKEKLVARGLLKDEKVQMAYARAQQEQMLYERNLNALREIEEHNKQVEAYQPTRELLEFYLPVYRAARKMVAGFCKLICLKGRGGIGKTFNMRNALIEAKADFIEIRGDVTPAYLYRILFDNSERIIYFNDVNRLLRHPESINMLKAATETEDPRILSKLSYSKDQEDLPKQFIFKGGIIFDYNYIEPSVKEDFEALLSRADYVELCFCIDDMKHIMRLVAKEEWQQKVTEHLVDNYEFEGLLLNLRNQAKAFNTYKYAIEKGLEWQKEVDEEQKATMSRTRNLLYSLIGNRAVRTTELVKWLIKSGVVSTTKTAQRRIEDWLICDELYKLSEDIRNFYVGINPIKQRQEPQLQVSE